MCNCCIKPASTVLNERALSLSIWLVGLGLRIDVFVDDFDRKAEDVFSREVFDLEPIKVLNTLCWCSSCFDTLLLLCNDGAACWFLSVYLYRCFPRLIAELLFTCWCGVSPLYSLSVLLVSNTVSQIKWIGVSNDGALCCVTISVVLLLATKSNSTIMVLVWLTSGHESSSCQWPLTTNHFVYIMGSLGFFQVIDHDRPACSACRARWTYCRAVQSTGTLCFRSIRAHQQGWHWTSKS